MKLLHEVCTDCGGPRAFYRPFGPNSDGFLSILCWVCIDWRLAMNAWIVKFPVVLGWDFHPWYSCYVPVP